MKIETTQVTKLRLTEIDGLDPVSVFLENVGKEQGKLTVECYGKAWSCYWGAMGCDINEFINSANVGYITGKLSNIQRNVIDYDKIAEECGIDDELCESNLLFYREQVNDRYGYDWQFNLPETENHEYTYLRKIVVAVKEAVKRQAP